MKSRHTISLVLLLLSCLSLTAQESYSGSSNLQLLYGKEQESSGIQLATLTAEHAGSYKAFEHFGFVDLLYTENNESFDIYMEWYPKLKLTHWAGENWSLGPLSAILLGGGINTLVKEPDDFFVVLGGPVWQFKVPGFDLFQLETYVFHQLEFSTSYQLTFSWEVPITFSEKIKFRFRGFVDLIGPYDALEEQILTQPQFLLDTGNLWGDPGKLFTGMEWRYWNNFGGQEGVNESIPQVEILFQF